MKAAPFRYSAPTTLEELLALVGADGDEEVRLLAGGQSLMPILALRLAQPEHLVDLNTVAGLDSFGAQNGELVVGAMVRQRTAERSPVVAAGCPLLAEALPLVGHVAIRNRGTIGGSIAHADPAAETPAVALALDATLVARSAAAERRIRADDCFRGYLETALEPGEVLTEVRFPRPGPRTGTALREVSRRHGDYALVGVAAKVTLTEGGTIADAALAFFGVGSTAVRATAAEAALRGAEPTAETFAEAAELVRGELDPAADLHASAAYRRHVAGVVARRALTTATDRARGAA